MNMYGAVTKVNDFFSFPQVLDMEPYMAPADVIAQGLEEKKKADAQAKAWAAAKAKKEAGAAAGAGAGVGAAGAGAGAGAGGGAGAGAGAANKRTPAVAASGVEAANLCRAAAEKPGHRCVQLCGSLRARARACVCAVVVSVLAHLVVATCGGVGTGMYCTAC